MESILPNNFCFPKKPCLNTLGFQLDLSTNYFSFNNKNKANQQFFKYAIVIEPEIPGDSVKLRSKIWRTARPKIQEILSHTIYNNNTCYSKINYEDLIEVPVTLEEINYIIKVKWANLVDDKSEEALGLYKRFFTTLVRKMNLIQIKRSYFKRNNATTINGIEVWGGFNPTVNLTSMGILLNISMIHKVLRPDTAFANLVKIQNNQSKDGDLQTEIRSIFKNNVVLTRYNNDKTYIIDDVDFTKTPKDTFETKTGPVSYMDYYKTKYNRSISNSNQPLFSCKDKKTGQIIYLIPELCYMTGLTDEMRSDFNLMKKMAELTSGNPGEKVRECTNLIKSFLENPKCQTDCEEWGMSINYEPIKINGKKLPAGNFLLKGGNDSFGIDVTDDIDRRIQNEMYSQPKLFKWMIFSTQKDEGLIQTFLQTLQQVKGSFKYPIDEPKAVYVKSQFYRDWEQSIKESIAKDVQMIVLIIPGNRGKGQIYNEVKRLLTVNFPIPCQCVLTSTVQKPRGFRSVVNKILMQICAKIGGEPWAVDKLPFTNVPTMVVGIDIYNKGSNTIVGCCASYNDKFTKYLSIVKFDSQTNEIYIKIKECVMEAVESFSKNNKIKPQHVIILRSGLTPSLIHTAGLKEILSIRSSLNEAQIDLKLTYLVINNKNILKLYGLDNGNIVNIPPGTLVDDKIVSMDKYEFFLVSQKATKGSPQATHYNVIYDEYGVKPNDIHCLIYKLCYLYYNWTGGIKIPAPCQYAKKLAMLVGDKLSTGNNINLPGDRFIKEIKSLFFL